MTSPRHVHSLIDTAPEDDWSRAASSMPRMSPKPFLTPPHSFVTMPTMNPPRAWEKRGMSTLPLEERTRACMVVERERRGWRTCVEGWRRREEKEEESEEKEEEREGERRKKRRERAVSKTASSREKRRGCLPLSWRAYCERAVDTPDRREAMETAVTPQEREEKEEMEEREEKEKSSGRWNQHAVLTMKAHVHQV